MSMESHLDASVILSMAEGSLGSSARAEADAHVAACGACRVELRLARAYVSQGIGADLGERSVRMRKRLRRGLGTAGPSVATMPRRMRAPAARWWGRGLLAASLAILAVGVAQVLRTERPDGLGQTVRSERGDDPWQMEVVASPEGWTVRWEAATSPSTLRVLSADGDLLLETGVTGTSIQLRREELTGGSGPLFVQLRGRDPLGGELRSPPVPLR